MNPFYFSIKRWMKAVNRQARMRLCHDIDVGALLLTTIFGFTSFFHNHSKFRKLKTEKLYYYLYYFLLAIKKRLFSVPFFFSRIKSEEWSIGPYAAIDKKNPRETEKHNIVAWIMNISAIFTSCSCSFFILYIIYRFLYPWGKRIFPFVNLT